MDGKIITYRKYQSGGSGTIYVPISVAESLGWKDKDELVLTFEVLNDKKGIFIRKKEP